MRIIEPVLIEMSTFISATGGAGAAVEMDFDFGNLEGALLERVEYRAGASLMSGLAGSSLYALDFDGTAVAAASEAAFNIDRSKFAYAGNDVSGTATAGLQQQTVDLKSLNLVIARNISFHVFVVGASTLGGVAAVYFRRTLFTQDEVGGLVAFRR